MLINVLWNPPAPEHFLKTYYTLFTSLNAFTNLNESRFLDVSSSCTKLRAEMLEIHECEVTRVADKWLLNKTWFWRIIHLCNKQIGRHYSLIFMVRGLFKSHMSSNNTGAFLCTVRNCKYCRLCLYDWSVMFLFQAQGNWDEWVWCHHVRAFLRSGQTAGPVAPHHSGQSAGKHL